jgi:hypothetical protein
LGFKYCLEKKGLNEGGHMNRLLRFGKRGEALAHIVTLKKGIIRSRQAGLRASSRDLEWYLTDNICSISTRGAK